jgi:ribosomal protein S18 acetylase RimI-like enzyme
VDRNQFYIAIKDAFFEPTEDKVERMLSDYLNGTGKELYGYYSGEKLVGIAAITCGSSITIDRIGIAPDERGRGLGSQFVRFLRDTKKKDVVAETDAGAVGFYEKCGFGIAKIIKVYGGEERVRFACILPYAP